jgi:DNA-binding winged helix-turn-helix (wHTH) protein
MDVRVFGPLQAVVDGRSVPLGGVKPRALLAILALNAGSTVSSERLIEGLWGEHEPATATKLVQIYVSQLRKALAAGGDDAGIVTRGRGYELRLGSGDVDARRFERLISQAAPRIGKSRLAEELTTHARERGARVLVGRCWEAGGAPAYWPWVQSLRGCVREAEPETLRAQLGTGAAELAQLLPELRQLFPELAQPPVLESEGARFRLFDATAEFLRSASESRPIVLLLDDLHVADAPSLLLLRFLARELGSTRVLLLGAYRDVDPLPGSALTELLAEVAREPVTRRLALSALSEREVARYIELTAADIASPELARGLHGTTVNDHENSPVVITRIPHPGRGG